MHCQTLVQSIFDNIVLEHRKSDSSEDASTFSETLHHSVNIVPRVHGQLYILRTLQMYSNLVWRRCHISKASYGISHKPIRWSRRISKISSFIYLYQVTGLLPILNDIWLYIRDDLLYFKSFEQRS